MPNICKTIFAFKLFLIPFETMTNFVTVYILIYICIFIHHICLFIYEKRYLFASSLLYNVWNCISNIYFWNRTNIFIIIYWPFGGKGSNEDCFFVNECCVWIEYNAFVLHLNYWKRSIQTAWAKMVSLFINFILWFYLVHVLYHSSIQLFISLH